MAKKIRTGFESVEMLDDSVLFEYAYPQQTSRFFGDLINGVYRNAGGHQPHEEGKSYKWMTTPDPNNGMRYMNQNWDRCRTNQEYIARQLAPDPDATLARENYIGGVFLSVGATHLRRGLSIDLNKVSDGLYCNWWYTYTHGSVPTGTIGNVIPVAALRSPPHEYHVAFKCDTLATAKLVIQAGTTNASGTHVDNTPPDDMVVVDSSATSVISSTQPVNNVVNFQWSVDAAGVITAMYNGQQVTYDTQTSFDDWTDIAFVSDIAVNGTWCIDDMAVNDGSGTTDNSMPGSIAGYLVPVDQVVDSTNFTTIGTGDMTTALTDSDASTYIMASTTPASVELSLPPLSAYVPAYEKVRISQNSGSYTWTASTNQESYLTGVSMIRPQIVGASSTQPNKKVTAQVKDTTSNNTQTSDEFGLIADVNSYSAELEQGDSGAWNLDNLKTGEYTVKFEIK